MLIRFDVYLPDLTAHCREQWIMINIASHMEKQTNDVRGLWPLSLAILALLLTAYFAVYKLAVKELPRMSPYQSAHLRSAPLLESTNIASYAQAVDPAQGRYRFAESKGKQLGVRLWLERSASLLIKTEPRYAPSRCRDEAVDNTFLLINSPHIQINQQLRRGDDVVVEFQAYRNGELSIELHNTVQAGCGNTFLTLYEKNNVKHYPLLFVVIWIALLLLCWRVQLPLLVVLSGMLFNVALLMIVRTIEISSLVGLLHLTLLATMLCGVWLSVLGLTQNRVLRTILMLCVFLLFLAIPILFGGHYIAFGSSPTLDTIHAILQSHKYQVIEFWRNILGVKYTLAVILGGVLLLTLLFISTKTKVNRKWAVLLGLILMLLGVRDYSTYLDINPMLHVTGSAVSSYFQELNAFQKLNESREQGLEQLSASTNQQDTTLLVVIGESANKWHMSSYGYPRSTTPTTDYWLAEKGMLRFNGAYSNHVYSNPTISRTLTAASNYNGLQWSATPSVMNLANAAGISTTWVSNKLKFGPWDSVMSVIGDDAQQTIHINKKVGKNLYSDRFDGALVPLVERALRKKSANKVIFVHLQGSHVEYRARYPIETHTRFSGPLSHKHFGLATQRENFQSSRVNSYDNSIYYTDEVLGQLLELLKESNKPTAFLYFSDHGENVFDAKSHNAALFEYGMTDIPLLFWANEPWQTGYKLKWQALNANLNAIFTNDHVFDTLLGLLSIKSGYTDDNNDLSSKAYQEEAQPSTLHGKKSLKNADNKSYWLTYNTRLLAQHSVPWKIAAQATSIGHAGQMVSSGVQLHLDIALSSLERNTGLDSGLIVLPRKENGEVRLHEYLRDIDLSKASSLTLRLPQISVSQRNVMIEKLHDLQQRLPSKLQLIVLDHWQNDDVSNYLEETVKTGFYLTKEMNIDEIANITKRMRSSQHRVIMLQTLRQLAELERLSVGAVLGSSGKKVDLVYMIDASAGLNIHSADFAKLLKQRDYLNAKNMSQLVVRFESVFAN